MAFLFGKNRQRSNSELCRSTRDLLQKLLSDSAGVATKANEKPNVASTRVEDELSRNLSQMKTTLQGTQDAEPNSQQVEQLVYTLISENVFPLLARSIRQLPFESRKDAQTIFSFAVRFKLEPRSSQNTTASPQLGEQGTVDTGAGPVVRYITHKCPEVLDALCNGYEHIDSAMPCGGMLREAIKHSSIVSLFLLDNPDDDGSEADANVTNPMTPKQDGFMLSADEKGASGPATAPLEKPLRDDAVFWHFFDWIAEKRFEISTDAFSTFKDMLTKHKKVVKKFLSVNYDRFFARFNEILVNSQSYVTKRQSVTLLHTILLEKKNLPIMMRYVEDSANLKLAMRLLADDRKMIKYEGWHVFKIFVANPNKSPKVLSILQTNRKKLREVLSNFLSDRTKEIDPQFHDEKAYVIKVLESMPLSPPQTPQASAGATPISVDVSVDSRDYGQ